MHGTVYKQHAQVAFTSITDTDEYKVRAMLLKYARSGYKDLEEHLANPPEAFKGVYRYIEAVGELKSCKKDQEERAIQLIKEYDLVREHVPTWFLKDHKEVSSLDIFLYFLEHYQTSFILMSL